MTEMCLILYTQSSLKYTNVNAQNVIKHMIVDCTKTTPSLIKKSSYKYTEASTVFNVSNQYISEDEISKCKIDIINNRLGLSLTPKELIDNDRTTVSLIFWYSFKYTSTL